ncbi:MAG: toxin-antitoxin system HicB family antitoxin [Mycobacteriales bacterium]
MDLSKYVEALRLDLAAAAAVGGPDVARAAELIADAIDPALRLVLLDVLTDAANDLTAALDGQTVDVRLRGREPELVVAAAQPEPPAALAPPADDEGTARLTLRLPETLKARAEQAASAEGLSVNNWLVRAVVRALEPSTTAFGGGGFSPRGPRRITGFGRT